MDRGHLSTTEPAVNTNEISNAVINHIRGTVSLQNEVLAHIKLVTETLLKVKDRVENMVKCLVCVEDVEPSSSSLAGDIKQTCSQLYILERHRDAESRRLQGKVVNIFGGLVVKERQDKARNEIEEILKELKRCMSEERKSMRQLRKSAYLDSNAEPFPMFPAVLSLKTSKSTSWDLAMKRASWKEAHNQVESVFLRLDEKLKTMELEKDRKFREIMKLYIEIQMVFHANALELLTDAFGKANPKSRNASETEETDWQATRKELGISHIETCINSYKSEGEKFCEKPVGETTTDPTKLNNSPNEEESNKAGNYDQDVKNEDDDYRAETLQHALCASPQISDQYEQSPRTLSSESLESDVVQFARDNIS
uniref:protein FAM92A-A-like n=1 Tax=Styela clava TaxID=7725 RepID=UPI00193A9E9E|nr:protein FAM92A-A-like [Styela clava]